MVGEIRVIDETAIRGDARPPNSIVRAASLT
jgi:hypothetical protein